MKNIGYSAVTGEQEYSQENTCIGLFLIKLQTFTPKLYLKEAPR